MKNLKVFSSAIAMLICFLTFGQEKNITGIVSDDLVPLPGINVFIKSTNKSVQTDVDGKYSIKAKAGDILSFQYIGYETKNITVGSSDVINVKLNKSSTVLEEVVITQGYRTKIKKTAAVASSTKVSSQTIENRPNSNVINTLQGQLAGVNISTGNGQPGTKSTVVIRGFGSTGSNIDPLYVIDGFPVDSKKFKSLKPENIVTLQVLKDSKAISEYGSRGSNGVIIIRTDKNLSKKEIEKLKLEANQNLPIDVLAKYESQEDYESFVENPFESPKTAPLSTFSIDVDNASYTNVRRFINNGQVVPKDAVRVEEMVNFFKYNYPQPLRENPFSINTEYSDCPWNSNNKLVRIGLQGKIIETDNLPLSNLVFLIDVSGSMSDPNKLPLLKQSLKILVKQLRNEDKISMVVYAGAAGLVLPPTSGKDKKTIIDALDKLQSGGSTAGGAGIELAYKVAQENFIKGGNNRVILATDGDFNVGSSSDSDMQTLIEEKRKSGVYLTCLGYGMGNYKDSKLETLADKGNGNYAYIDNIQEANRFLGKEFKGSMFAIAKDVKIQIEFNPKHVQAYRLIGYENRKLRDEDFTNDTIDAGELGSGHTVTALYEIIPRGVKSDLYNEPTDLKYSVMAEPSSKNYSEELATIKFRYKKPDGDKSIEIGAIIANKSNDLQSTSEDFKFCASVAWFGLKLRDSKLVVNKSNDAILELANQGLTNDTEGYRSEFIRLIESSTNL
ncbi:von Willebrand factor type A domain-containing protein [Flavobacterium sp.]|jgi:Ca-activated chloride channel family protein|uniref:YfbK domain-containing protein n=1 Tax=Flavobacterium sp. TaxID=239 RepID=UPI0037C06EE8